jgi:hypothetical protein
MNQEFITKASNFARQNPDIIRYMKNSDNPIDRELAERILEAEKLSKLEKAV